MEEKPFVPKSSQYEDPHQGASLESTEGLYSQAKDRSRSSSNHTRETKTSAGVERDAEVYTLQATDRISFTGRHLTIIDQYQGRPKITRPMPTVPEVQGRGRLNTKRKREISEATITHYNRQRKRQRAMTISQQERILQEKLNSITKIYITRGERRARGMTTSAEDSDSDQRSVNQLPNL